MRQKCWNCSCSIDEEKEAIGSHAEQLDYGKTPKYSHPDQYITQTKRNSSLSVSPNDGVASEMETNESKSAHQNQQQFGGETILQDDNKNQPHFAAKAASAENNPPPQGGALISQPEAEKVIDEKFAEKVRSNSYSEKDDGSNLSDTSGGKSAEFALDIPEDLQKYAQPLERSDGEREGESLEENGSSEGEACPPKGSQPNGWWNKAKNILPMVKLANVLQQIGTESRLRNQMVANEQCLPAGALSMATSDEPEFLDARTLRTAQINM